jgi:hypothetical protein
MPKKYHYAHIWALYGRTFDTQLLHFGRRGGALEAQDFGGPFLPVMCQPVWDWLLQHFSALIIAGP